MNATERRIAGFIDKYAPEIAAQLRDARQRLRAHFPRGVEMVFDNYNALVVVKMEVGKQRPRRPAVAAKKAKA